MAARFCDSAGMEFRDYIVSSLPEARLTVEVAIWMGLANRPLSEIEISFPGSLLIWATALPSLIRVIGTFCGPRQESGGKIFHFREGSRL